MVNTVKASQRTVARGSERRVWRFGGPGMPPVPFSAIHGQWWVTRDLVWPAVVWRGGRCWAYLHDMTPAAVQTILERLRVAELDRSRPHGVLTGWQS